MRLYALHKRQFVAVFVLFFICLFITILIGIAGPSIIQSVSYTSESHAKVIVNGMIFSKKLPTENFLVCLVWPV